MTNAIDRESLTQLKKELQLVVDSTFSGSRAEIFRVDAELLLQVIQEWEHNEDAHLQGDDYVECDELDFDMIEVHKDIMKG